MASAVFYGGDGDDDDECDLNTVSIDVNVLSIIFLAVTDMM